MDVDAIGKSLFELGDIGNMGMDADHHLSLSHDIIGKVTQPNFRPDFVARFIVSDRLPEVAENRRFLVSADLGQPHRIPRGYPALRSIGESGKDRLRCLIRFPEVGD